MAKLSNHFLIALSILAAAGCHEGGDADGGTAPVSHAPKLVNGVLVGEDAYGDWRSDRPGLRRKITSTDMPSPYATRSYNNPPQIVPRPSNMWPLAPKGFKVDLYASGLVNPREIVTAPNGDLFVASLAGNRLYVLRGMKRDGTAQVVETFSEGLKAPFGLAFYPPGQTPKWLYVGNTDSVVRFPYKNGDLHATGPSEFLCQLPGWGRLTGGGHMTRDVRFSPDGKTMYVSVGSFTNDYENPKAPEEDRADILAFDPLGKNKRIFASGIRNAVGLAIQPGTGQLWCSVNERDVLGDNLVPDYISRVDDNDFFGWPWYYIGPNWDPRHKGERPDLKDKVRVPDVLLQAHSASLCITFYDGKSFPSQYQGQAFAAEHGSWNRKMRTGYKVVSVPMEDGKPTGEYDDFLTGFVTPQGQPWGRPVGVAVVSDGSLMVSDDGSNSIWRIHYQK